MTSEIRTDRGASITMQRVMMMTALAASACTPSPEDAGEIEPSSQGGEASESGETDTSSTGATSASEESSTAESPMDDPFGDWVELGDTIDEVRLAISEDFLLVAASRADLPADSGQSSTIAWFELDLSSSTERELEDGWVTDVSPTSDGFVAGGNVTTETGFAATAWRLSCCGEVVATRAFESDIDTRTTINVVVAQGDGVMLARAHDQPGSALLLGTDLDLVPSWELEADFSVGRGAAGPGDTVLLRANEGGSAHLLFEVQPDGTGDGLGKGELLEPIGDGDNLGLLGLFGPNTLTIRPYVGIDGGGGAVSEINDEVVPPLVAFDGRGHFAVATRTTPINGVPPFVHVTEFEMDGTVLRTLDIPVPAGTDTFEPTALAMGHDNAIYIAARERPEPPDPADHPHFLIRIDPL